jgi:hypothetical protein
VLFLPVTKMGLRAILTLEGLPNVGVLIFL